MSRFVRIVICGIVFGMCIAHLPAESPLRAIVAAIAYCAACIGASAWHSEFGE